VVQGERAPQSNARPSWDDLWRFADVGLCGIGQGLPSPYYNESHERLRKVSLRLECEPL